MSAVAFEARYFDAATSTRRAASAVGEGGRLRVHGEGWERDEALADVRVLFPVTGTRHYLCLPGGAQLATDDAAAVAALFARPPAGWLQRVEARWELALAAFVGIALVVAWVVFFGLPLLAQKAAAHVPEAVSRELGEQALAVFDRAFCRPSALPDAEQERIRQGPLRRATEGLPDWGRYYVQFRKCRRVGANAFALPDGTIVMTDEMVALAGGDEELAAILAHEVGHVRERHGLRMALQAAGVAALVTGITGDAVSISSLAPILPIVLLQSGYSRRFEEEADAFALAQLRAARIPARRFADVLERLEAERAGQSWNESSGGYLSTHPATKERVERARAQ